MTVLATVIPEGLSVSAEVTADDVAVYGWRVWTVGQPSILLSPCAKYPWPIAGAVAECRHGNVAPDCEEGCGIYVTADIASAVSFAVQQVRLFEMLAPDRNPPAYAVGRVQVHGTTAESSWLTDPEGTVRAGACTIVGPLLVPWIVAPAVDAMHYRYQCEIEVVPAPPGGRSAGRSVRWLQSLPGCADVRTDVCLGCREPVATHGMYGEYLCAWHRIFSDRIVEGARERAHAGGWLPA